MTKELTYDLEVGGDRYRFTWLGRQEVGTDRVRALAFVGTRSLLLVRGDSGMQLPGGGVEPGESTLDAVARELWEEASASVLAIDLLGSLLIEGLTRPLREVHGFFWCRVALAPDWTPPHDIVERVVVDAASFQATLGWGDDPKVPFLLDLALSRQSSLGR